MFMTNISNVVVDFFFLLVIDSKRLIDQESEILFGFEFTMDYGTRISNRVFRDFSFHDPFDY